MWSVPTGERLGTFATDNKNNGVWASGIVNGGQAWLTTEEKSRDGSSTYNRFAWNPHTGKRAPSTLMGAGGQGWGALSPDGKEFATTGETPGQLLWLDARSGERKAQYKSNLTRDEAQKIFGRVNSGSSDVTYFDWAPGGGWLASRSEAEITVFNSKAKKVGALTIDDERGQQFAVSPDGQWVAASGALPYAPNGELLWNVKTGQKIRLEVPFPALLDWNFSPDGKQLYGVFADGEELKFATWKLDAAPEAKPFVASDSTAFQPQSPNPKFLNNNDVIEISTSSRMIAFPSPDSIEFFRRDGALWKSFAVSNASSMEFASVMKFFARRFAVRLCDAQQRRSRGGSVGIEAPTTSRRHLRAGRSDHRARVFARQQEPDLRQRKGVGAPV